MIERRDNQAELAIPDGIDGLSTGRRVPLNATFLEEFAHYRATRGISVPLPSADDKSALANPLNGEGPITVRHLQNCVMDLFRRAADYLDGQREWQAASLVRSAKPRWLRRSYAIHLVEDGTDPLVAARIVGWSSSGLLYEHRDGYRDPHWEEIHKVLERTEPRIPPCPPIG